MTNFEVVNNFLTEHFALPTQLVVSFKFKLRTKRIIWVIDYNHHDSDYFLDAYLGQRLILALYFKTIRELAETIVRIFGKYYNNQDITCKLLLPKSEKF